MGKKKQKIKIQYREYGVQYVRTDSVRSTESTPYRISKKQNTKNDLNDLKKNLYFIFLYLRTPYREYVRTTTTLCTALNWNSKAGKLANPLYVVTSREPREKENAFWLRFIPLRTFPCKYTPKLPRFQRMPCRRPPTPYLT